MKARAERRRNSVSVAHLRKIIEQVGLQAPHHSLAPHAAIARLREELCDALQWVARLVAAVAHTLVPPWPLQDGLCSRNLLLTRLLRRWPRALRRRVRLPILLDHLSPQRTLGHRDP